MTGTNKGIVLGRLCLFLCGTILVASSVLHAEPACLVYPNVNTVFRFDASRYELIYPGNQNYLPALGSQTGMLWDKIEQRVPMEVYRAPLLEGFEPSPFGTSEFVTMRNEFNIVVDGYGEMPRRLSNLYVRFFPEQPHSIPLLFLDGQQVDRLTVPLPPLTVVTEIEDGVYADTRSHHLSWSGAIGIRIIVFSDKNNNGVYDDGVPLYSIYVEDNTIPVSESTWGGIKALYK